jgi:hypothetical protein
MLRRSAIHPTVRIGSARKRPARATFPASPLGRGHQIRLLAAPPAQFRRDDLFCQPRDVRGDGAVPRLTSVQRAVLQL